MGGDSAIEVWAETHPGRSRSNNEDNFLVDKGLQLYIVADGMGGHAAGEVASSMCVRRVRETLAGERALLRRLAADHPGDRRQILRLLEHAIQAASSAIYERAQAQPERRGMGTTCTLLLLAGQRGFMAHVGDSRLYLVRQGQVHQLSEDHSLINELIRRGRLRREEIETSPYRNYKNAVTRAVGVYETVEVDTLDFEVLPGDQFLLCSDGLSHYLDLEEDAIQRVLAAGDVKETTRAFIDLANAGGGHDNITAVVVRLPEAPEQEARARDLALRIGSLKSMPIFRLLDYSELVHVLSIAEAEDHPDGAQVIAEGDDASALYIVLEGAVTLHKGDTFVCRLGSGSHFGEMALVDQGPRSASVVTDGPARLLVIRREPFYELIRAEQKIAVKLLWSFVRVLAARLRKTTADLSGARMEATLPDLTDEALLFD